MKEYAIEQRKFNEKSFGSGTRSLDSAAGLLNKYAKEGWVLHSMMTFPTRDERTQLVTMVFERDIPGTVTNAVPRCSNCGNQLLPGATFCGKCGFRTF